MVAAARAAGMLSASEAINALAPPARPNRKIRRKRAGVAADTIAGEFMKTLVLVTVAALALATSAAAQPPPGPGMTPGFSPYLNLLNRGNPAINYYGLVRPQFAFQNAIAGLQHQQQSLAQPADPTDP